MSPESAARLTESHVVWGLVPVFLMIAGVAGGQPASERGEADQPRIGSFEALTESAQGLDWEQESRRWLQAVDKVFERRGWTSESHQYARSMIHDVTAVPPWDIVGRFNVITECMRGRYDLSPEQVSRLKSTMAREWGGLLMQHGGTILEQTTEILQTRVANKPFTAEQVARWTKESEPMMRASHESAERVRSDVDALLRSDQRELWDRDWDAFLERWDAVDAMRSEWAQGKWDAAEWGLEEDPIQRGVPAEETQGAAQYEPPSDEARSRRANAQPTKWLAHDPSTWVAYIRDMKERCTFSPGQTDAAWSIHAELVERATAYIETHAAQLESVPDSERSTDEGYEPVRTIFEELRERLHAMLTDRQRDHVHQ